MAAYTIQDTTLRDIADAIRDKKNEVLEVEYQMVNSVANTSFNIVKDKTYRLILIPSELIADGEGQLEFTTQTASANYAGYFGSGITKYVVGEPMELIFTAPYDGTLFRIVNITKKGTGSKIASATVKLAEIKEDGSLANVYKPSEMAAAINEFEAIPNSALIITGNCQYRFAYGGWDWLINQMGDKITTKDISNANNMFASSKVSEIPFDINLTVITNTSTKHNLSRMFASADHLQAIPMIYNALPNDVSSLFQNCESLTTFPEGFAENWDWSFFDTATSGYNGNMAQMFYYCMKLRKIPKIFFLHGNPSVSYSYATTYNGFTSCYSLEELEDVFIPHKASLSGTYANIFTNMVVNCGRLKKLTLMTQEDGTPYTVNWKDQTIDLTSAGFCATPNTMTNRTDFTNDTKIDTVEKWHGYMDGSYPDGWAASVEYSTFGATAVKELIATLPTASGTNTMKLKNAAASAIPGEEMTSLTEEDIAVATEKGWTITFV